MIQDQYALREQEGARTKLAMIRLCERIWDTVRTELYLSMRFLEMAFGRMEYRMDLTTRTWGTDGEFCYYNPSYLMMRYEENPAAVNRALLHMLLHGVFCHMYSENSVAAKNSSERGAQEALYDLACDIAVESVIDSMEYHSVAAVVRDERLELYERLKKDMSLLTADGIYDWLKKNRADGGQYERLCAEFRQDDHTFFYRDRRRGAGGESPGGDSGPKSDRQDPGESRGRREWQKIGRKIGISLSLARSQGKRAGSLAEVLAVEGKEYCDYGEFLRKFAVIREENRLDLDSFDYGYYTYGLSLYGNLPLIEPLEQREVKRIEEFVVVVDTSGSCSGRLVRRFLRETFTILRQQESFFLKRNIHVIQCDAKVQSDTVITCEEDLLACERSLTVSGYGGTDFRPAFLYVNRLMEEGCFTNLKGLLYFTDGFGIYPERPTSYAAAFVFPDYDYEERRVPGWAAKIVLNPETMREWSVS